MNGTELSRALTKGESVYGTAILSASPLWPKMVASMDLDFVFIDTEHTPLNRETVSWMCHAYRSLNLASLVRIPSPDPYQACMVLDGGASGVIAPYVETAGQVQDLVGAVKCRPVKGDSLVKHLSGVKWLGESLQDYLRHNNRENVLVINIESVPAIEKLDEILSVEGLDAVLIGPHDLTCSLGIPEQYQHPLFRESVETIIARARAKGVAAGVHVWDAVGFDQEIHWARNGANLIMHSSDLLIFRDALQKDIRRIKETIMTRDTA